MNNHPEASRPHRTKSAFLLRLAAAFLLLNLFVISLMIMSLRQSRDQYEKRAAVITVDLAQVLDEHIDSIIDKTEIILFAAVEEFEQKSARGGIDRRELVAFLNRMVSRMPELERLVVANAHGRVVYHTGPYVEALTDVSDREYFLHLRHNPGAGLHISRPIRSRVSGRRVIIFARRINLSDGSFAGTVSAALSQDYINRLFTSINVGPHGAIELRDGELGLIASCPESAGTGSIIGEKKVSREMAELFQAGKKKGTYKTITPVDQVERTYSFRRLSQYPLYIAVGLADSDYLKEWRNEVAKITVAALLFLLVTLFSALMIYKGWRSRTAMIGALAEQEVKYRTVADYTYDWEYWLGPDGAFRYISPSCGRITGYDAEQFYEDSDLLNRLIHKDDRELYAAHHREELKGTDSLVFRIVRADGSIRWMEHSGRPIVDEAGKFLGTRCCNRDITERKLAEKSLLETYFSVDYASIPIFWIGKDSRFLYVNRACDYLGYSREELLEMSVYDIDPDFSKEEIARIQEAIRDRGSFTFERCHRTKAGAMIPVEVTRHDIRLPGQEFHVSYVRDISEKKEHEALIARSEQKFRAIFESARDAIFLIAADSRYVDCNPAATKMFGCAKEELLTRNPQYYSPFSQPDGRGTEQKTFDLIAAALEGQAQSFEWRHRRPDGSEFDAMVVLSRFELDGAPMLLAIVRDISEKKDLERQLYHMQKMESIGTLAGGIAHDFNNLLTAITGYGHIIKMRMEPGDPQLAMIEQILHSSDRAAQLTRGLLTFSRKQTIDPRPVDLNDIVKGVERLLERLIGADVNFMTKLAGMPLKIFADAGQLEQVLMNLATNARDAMPEGGELLIATEELYQRHFSFHGLIKPGKYALITVSDTGNGMDEQTRAKIFEPFFTTKEIGHGTGLGLAIAYGIIKQHNGFINVYSELGKGTTFQIHLPLISEMLRDTEINPEPVPRGGTETILFAEDSDVVRKMTETFLRDFGYRVIEAVDGEDALEKFARHEQEVDLLILDVIMPKKNGAEVCEAVKSVRPDVDILFLSGHSFEILRNKGLQDAEIAFMSKPVSPLDLLEKIRDILDRNL
jgi:two-component system, cell cycle sensor histidine kinase and response regulator CckA